MAAIVARHELTWKGRYLYLRDRRVASIEPDSQWSGIWRVRWQGKLSDMVTISRAKDAAMCVVLADSNRQETGRMAPLVAFPAGPLVALPRAA